MKVKECITIKTEEGKEFETMEKIHEQLLGNKDYIDSNIILNDSSTRCDGTKNEVRVYIFDECEKRPVIKI